MTEKPDPKPGQGIVFRITYLYDELLPLLTHSELRVLLCLIKHADREGRAFPGLELISQKTGMSIHRVSNNIGGLRALGLVEVEGDSDRGGRKRVPIYQLIMPRKTLPESGQVRRRKKARKHCRNRSETLPNSDGNIAGIRHEHNKEELSKELSKELSTIPESPAAPAEIALFPGAESNGNAHKGKPASHPQVVKHWCERWQAAHGIKFDFQPKDGAIVSKLLKRCEGDANLACATIDAYLADDEKFVESHPSNLLLARMDKYLIRAKGLNRRVNGKRFDSGTSCEGLSANVGVGVELG